MPYGRQLRFSKTWKWSYFFLFCFILYKTNAFLRKRNLKLVSYRTLSPLNLSSTLYDPLTAYSSLLTLKPHPLPLTPHPNHLPSLLLLTPRPRIRPYGNIHSANLLKVKGLFLLYKIYNNYYLHVKLFKGAAAYLRNTNP